jgi:thioredoxin 1
MTVSIKTLNEYNKYLNNNTYVVANFTASFCKPCKEIYPFIEELNVDNPNILFIKIDIDEGSDISDNHNISSIPYFKFYKNSIEVNSYCGTDKKLIREALSNLINNKEL